MAFWAVGAQALGTGLNFASQQNAQRGSIEDLRRSKGWLSQLNQYGRQATAQHESYLNRLPTLINRGYGQARQSLSTAGASARQGINDRGKQDIAASSQSMASRGLYNTGALDAASRGIHADTSRALASVDESIGQMMGSLSIGRSQALGGAYQTLAAFQSQKYQEERMRRMDMINLIMGNQLQPSQVTGLGDLASALKGIKWTDLPADPGLTTSSYGPPQPGYDFPH